MASTHDQPDALPLPDRPEWVDVQPLLQPQPPVPVVAIEYSDDDRPVLEYFRAVVAGGEVSERTLALTEEVISVNGADYTAWSWRWRCLRALDADLGGELALIDCTAAGNAKNYQLWNHRRRVVLARGAEHATSGLQELAAPQTPNLPLLGSSSGTCPCTAQQSQPHSARAPWSCAQELEASGTCLASDSKNYHAWAHRQAIVAHFGLWQQELAAVTAHLKKDVRNNSAWNQRFFIVAQAPDMGSMEERFESELAFVRQLILACPHNDSSWAYACGLCCLPGQQAQLALHPGLPALGIQVLQMHPSCSPALALLQQVYAAKALAAVELGQDEAAQKARAAAQRLALALQTTDPLRQPFWRFQQAQRIGPGMHDQGSGNSGVQAK